MGGRIKLWKRLARGDGSGCSPASEKRGLEEPERVSEEVQQRKERKHAVQVRASHCELVKAVEQPRQLQ